MRSPGIARILGSLLIFAQIFFYLRPTPVHAVVYTWDGGGTDMTCGGDPGDGNNWSCAANWSSDIVPGASDIATFSSLSTKNAVIDTDFAGSVAGIDINTGYTGTITQARSITIGASNFDQADGFFVGSSDAMTITGNFAISGAASFTAPSGTLTLSGTWTDSSTTATFAHNNGTVVFAPNAATRNINLPTSETFYNVEINATSNTNTAALLNGDTMIVSNILTLTNGQVGSSGSIIRVDGTISHAATFDGGQGVLNINAPIALTPSAGYIYPGLNLVHAGSSFTGPGSGEVFFEAALTVGPGTFNAGAGTIQIERAFNVVTNGTFFHDGGTIEAASISGTATYNVDGTETFNNLLIDAFGATAGIAVAAGDTINVIGTLTLADGLLNATGTPIGILNSNGTLVVDTGFDGGTGQVTINTPTALTPAAGQIYAGFIFADPGSSFTGPGSGTVTFQGPVNVDNGTFTTGAGTIAFARDLTVETAASFVTGSGTVNFTGVSPVDVDVSATFNNVTVNGTSVTVATGDSLEVNGLLTLTNGAINGPGIVSANGTFSHAATFDGGNGVVEFPNVVTITLANTERLPGLHLLASGSTVNGAVVSTNTSFIMGDLTLTSGTTFNAGPGTLTLGRDITIDPAATFNHDSGTIIFNDETNIDHEINGEITFNNLSYINASTNTGIIFPAGDTTTVLGDLNFYIDSSNPPLGYTIASSTPGVQAILDFQGSKYTVHDATVQDIDNVGGTTLRCVVRCVDDGNNDGWYFGQPGILVSAVSGDTTEAGGIATFTVELRNEPQSDVTVAVASSDATEGTVSAATLTFTSLNWDTPQTVTITGQDDADDDGGVEYVVNVGPATSGDTLYDGLEAADIELYNIDNDADADTLRFEDPADFTFENLAETYGITWFGYDYYAFGYLADGEFGTEVDLTGTKIRSGCDIVVDGEEYKIAFLWNQADSPGYISVSNGVNSPFELDDQSILVSGEVDGIYCSSVSPDGQGLATDDFVVAQEVDMGFVEVGGSSMVYDAANDAMWTDNGSPLRVNLTSLTVDEFTRQNGFEPGIALDPTRGMVWYANNSSDSISKIDTTTGVATNYSICLDPENAVYDSVQDSIWVLCSVAGGPDAVQELDPVTGAVLQTVPLQTENTNGSFTTAGIVFDPVNNRIWALFDGGDKFVVINAATGGYAFGTLAASTFSTQHSDTTFANVKTILYMEDTDTVWIMNGQCDTDEDGDFVTIFDAATADIVGYVNVPSCPIDAAIDPITGNAFFSSDHEGTFTEVSAVDNTIVKRHISNWLSYPLEFDNEGDLWVSPCCEVGFYEFVRDGVPTNEYYTTITSDAGQIDSSLWESIDGLTIEEDSQGQSINYAISFDDRDSFKVWGSWRTIASSLTADHGGADGDWYYRDDADVWTPAPSNTPEEAISLAVENGPTNNTMDSATLTGLSSGSWALAGGFIPGSTTTIDIATILYSDDAHDSPTVQAMAFAVSSGGAEVGGGGGSSMFVTEGGIQIEAGATCTADGSVTLSLSASGAQDMLVSNQADLEDATWESFTTSKTWSLTTGDGTKTVYVKYRSSDGNVTGTYSDTITLDEANDCSTPVSEPEGPVEEDPDEEVDEEVVEEENPIDEDTDGEAVAPVLYTPEDFVSTDDGALYFVNTDGTLRPFTTPAVYGTYVETCTEFKYISDETLAQSTLGLPMMPAPGSVLVKFKDGSEVYAIAENSNPELVTLRWIVNEDAALAAYGATWKDYVIEIDRVTGTYELGDPITGAESAIDETQLKSRASLTGGVSYNLFIINPDGTRRDAFSAWTQIDNNADGTLTFNFEDKGSDFDFNDVVIIVDPRSCQRLTFAVMPMEARWHHQIGIEIFYEGVLQDTLMLWQDSHASVNEEKTVNVTYAPDFEASIQTRDLTELNATAVTFWESIQKVVNKIGSVGQ